MSMEDIWPDPERGYADRDLEAVKKIEGLQAKVAALESENARFRKILQDLVDLPLQAYRNKPIELTVDISEIREAAKMSLKGPSPT